MSIYLFCATTYIYEDPFITKAKLPGVAERRAQVFGTGGGQQVLEIEAATLTSHQQQPQLSRDFSYFCLPDLSFLPPTPFPKTLNPGRIKFSFAKVIRALSYSLAITSLGSWYSPRPSIWNLLFLNKMEVSIRCASRPLINTQSVYSQIWWILNLVFWGLGGAARWINSSELCLIVPWHRWPRARHFISAMGEDTGSACPGQAEQ